MASSRLDGNAVQHDAAIPCSVCGEPFVPSGRRNLRLVRRACSSCREKARAMRPKFAPPKVEHVRHMTKRAIEEGRRLYPVENIVRPRTRAECIDGERPCPFISCQYHLALDVTDVGSIKWNFPGVELEDMPETCALDVADRGPTTLEEVGALTNITRERIRQLEEIAYGHLRKSRTPAMRELAEAARDGFCRRPESVQDLEEEGTGGGAAGEPDLVPVPAFLRGEDGPLAARLLRAWRELTDVERAEIDVWAETVATRMRDGLRLRSAIAICANDVEVRATALMVERSAEVVAASAPGAYAETITEDQVAKLLRPVPGVVRSLRKDPPPKNVLGPQAVREVFGLEIEPAEEEKMGAAKRGERLAQVVAIVRELGSVSAKTVADRLDITTGNASQVLYALRDKDVLVGKDGQYSLVEGVTLGEVADATVTTPAKKMKAAPRAARVARPKATARERPADVEDPVIAPLIAKRAELVKQLARVDAALAAYVNGAE